MNNDKLCVFILTHGRPDNVITYTVLGSRGDLFFTIPFIALAQKATQIQKGGISEFYAKYGTYVKSFTTVLMHPSGVKVSMMRTSNARLHHAIKWINVAPMIINEKYKIKE